MVDLSTAGVLEYWKDYEDKSLFKVILSIEEVEDWVLDGNEEMEKYIHALANHLDKVYMLDTQEYPIEDDLIRVLSSISLSRMLRIMQVLDENSPGLAGKILSFAEEHSESINDHHGLLLRRNLIFEKLRLTSRIFSQQRFEEVVKALESAEE